MNGQSMTYDELNHYANRIANELMKNGVTYGERVALLVDRSFEMIASMIASWKIGASYVPIDITHPDKRIELMIEDAQVSAILTYGKEFDSNLLTIALESIDKESPVESHFQNMRVV